jgi:hypothetical protein
VVKQAGRLLKDSVAFSKTSIELHPEFPFRLFNRVTFPRLFRCSFRAYAKMSLFRTVSNPSEILSENKLRSSFLQSTSLGSRGAYCKEDGYLEDCSGFTNSFASRAEPWGFVSFMMRPCRFCWKIGSWDERKDVTDVRLL